jgi:hypothetical protein
MTVLGGLLIVVGSFLPWLTLDSAFSIPTITYNGIERGDGIITLLLGVITILIGVSQVTTTRLPGMALRSSIATAVIAGMVAIYDYLDEPRHETEVAVSARSGIWILILGAILAIVGGGLVQTASKS